MAHSKLLRVFSRRGTELLALQVNVQELRWVLGYGMSQVHAKLDIIIDLIQASLQLTGFRT